MRLLDINPYLRYADLQPSVLSSVPFCRAYDFRLFYVLDGQAELVLSDASIPVGAGALIYLRPGIPYYFSGKVKVIVLNFDMTLNQSHMKEPIDPNSTLNCFDPSLVFENDPPRELDDYAVVHRAFEMEAKMQECRFHMAYPTPYSDAKASAVVKDILCYMVQKISSGKESFPELVQRLLLFVEQNYDRILTNQQIADELGYHSYYLNRVFKKSTGMTIHQAVIREKMRVAESLLKETALTIGAIAMETGFADTAQFCAIFKKHTGSTPTEYRKTFT